MKKKRVVVGLSGGVDSSVAAYLLKEQGYEVIAVFMINWHDKTGLLKGDCPWDEDLTFAQMVARKLDIPIHVEDLSEEYTRRVVDYMFGEYGRGRTPNPDVLCNREIKFDAFLKAVAKYEPDYVATGHYCRKEEINTGHGTVYRLMAGKDPGKDQSYFLCQLNQEQLRNTLFPIGDLLKSEVRDMARSAKLASATKKDSQGICFVGKVDLPVFLQQKLAANEGDVIEIDASAELYLKNNSQGTLAEMATPWQYMPEMGSVAGRHRGAHFFTVGQRKGLNIGGKKEALFVIGTDIERNIVYVGQGEEHPGLFRKALVIASEDLHWVRPDLKLEPGETLACKARIRYRQPLQAATLHCRAEGIYVVFDEAQRAIAPGQFAAWYVGEELVGSGVIGM